MNDYSLNAASRIKKRREFLQVQDKGKKIYAKNFLIAFKPSDSPRFGVTVSKKVDKRAVVRNKIKRRLRELYRLHRASFLESFDIVIIARKGSQTLEYAEIKKQILSSLKKAKILP